eukprot:4617890-Amphidinium_carterae.1
MEEYRHSASTERHQRRDERLQGRFRNTKEELVEMRNALIAIVVHRRRQRLEEREMTRPKPKAPPGVRVPTKEINKMTTQELREAIRE